MFCDRLQSERNELVANNKQLKAKLTAAEAAISEAESGERKAESDYQTMANAKAQLEQQADAYQKL